MFSRLTFTILLASLALAGARASDAIPEPTIGRSNIVAQPHVTAELIAESTTFSPGKPVWIALHLHTDPDWHTYWINPGGAGLATKIAWTLPTSFTEAGPIYWPVPELHSMGPITTYGYGGDVYLLSMLSTAGDLGENTLAKQVIKAHASWLVCKEECIPGKADLSLTLTYDRTGKKPIDPASKAFFDAAHARLPIDNGSWDVTGAYQGDKLELTFKPQADRVIHQVPPVTISSLHPNAAPPHGHLRFLAEQPNVLSTDDNALTLAAAQGNMASGTIPLAQNGGKPDHLSGVLVSDEPLQDGAKAIQLFGFPVGAAAEPPPSPATSIAKPVLPPGVKAPAAPPALLAVLGAAFLGGLILNLMPCVLPVLSLKVFSLIKHAESGSAWRQGVAFTAGVLVSFWVLAGLLIALQSAGHHLGWGFQMQSPGFVLALTFLFFLLGLNLFGVFEFGTSLSGLDAKATSHLGGLASSFANGALATLAATPCTAPFMGSAVGFAAQQPAFVSLLVFTVLALGMAAPYLALTIFPGALRLVPKPGAWMEVLKQFMAFLLMGTVIFLVYVFAAETGQESVPMLLGALLVAALAAWIYGRASSPLHEPATRIGWMLVVLALMAGSIGEGIRLTHHKPAASVISGDWQPWSSEAVKQALAKGQPVFVDFTAAWCLSCKVNEQVALDIDSTKKLFADKHVALFRGDWTNSDPKISDLLRQYNRNGVPLYLVYSPAEPDAPQILPEVLTPGIVQDALQKLP